MKQRQIDILQQQWIMERAVGHCLHLGCGSKPIRGAVNIDPDPSKRKWADMVALGLWLPFPNGTFDSVVTSHVLPVFWDINQILYEMARVMQIGGRMAHVIPDLRFAPSRRGSSYPFERQYSGWFGPEDFMSCLHSLEDVLCVTKTENFTEFNWSFKFEAIRI